jgi:hypothetical protein
MRKFKFAFALIAIAVCLTAVKSYGQSTGEQRSKDVAVPHKAPSSVSSPNATKAGSGNRPNPSSTPAPRPTSASTPAPRATSPAGGSKGSRQ